MRCWSDVISFRAFMGDQVRCEPSGLMCCLSTTGCDWVLQCGRGQLKKADNIGSTHTFDHGLEATNKCPLSGNLKKKKKEMEGKGVGWGSHNNVMGLLG